MKYWIACKIIIILMVIHSQNHTESESIYSSAWNIYWLVKKNKQTNKQKKNKEKTEGNEFSLNASECSWKRVYSEATLPTRSSGALPGTEWSPAPVVWEPAYHGWLSYNRLLKSRSPILYVSSNTCSDIRSFCRSSNTAAITSVRRGHMTQRKRNHLKWVVYI